MAIQLSSNSSLAEINAAYEDHCDYDLEGSVEDCRVFIKACRILLRRMTEEDQRGDRRIRDSYVKIRDELAKAESWLKANDSTQQQYGNGSVIHASFEDFRG